MEKKSKSKPKPKPKPATQKEFFISDQQLRQRGYMTTDEFVDTLIPGLKNYLSKNWGERDKDSLHHPEDIISNITAYVEIACQVVYDFGVSEKTKKLD